MSGIKTSSIRLKAHSTGPAGQKRILRSNRLGADLAGQQQRSRQNLPEWSEAHRKRISLRDVGNETGVHTQDGNRNQPP
jgi:hypothetical protein